MQHIMLQKENLNMHCNATPKFVTICATMEDNEKLSDELKAEFGKWLQDERKLAKVTQDEVAGGNKSFRAHLSRIETGQTGTTRDTLIHIVRTINRKTKTGYKINIKEALDRMVGRWDVAFQDNSNQSQVPDVIALIDFSDLEETEIEVIVNHINLVKKMKKSGIVFINSKQYKRNDKGDYITIEPASSHLKAKSLSKKTGNGQNDNEHAENGKDK